MLKRKAIRKIIITTFSIITILIICIIPSGINNDVNFLNPVVNTTYVDNSETGDIYLLGSNNYLVKVSVLISGKSVEEKVKEIIKYLTISNNTKIPNGLYAVIPESTKLNNVSISDKIVTLDFSSELLNVDEKLEERLIESIIYSIVNIDGVEGLYLKIDGKDLLKLPKTHKLLPSVLNRNYGINKVYEIDSINNINKVIMYYINKIDEKKYYVPVTKYLNDENEKIRIIIENLSGNYIYDSTLISFLNPNTELINYDIENNTMKLNFNQEIFTDNKLLEEVIYPIAQSVFENYNTVQSVLFEIEGEEKVNLDRNISVK